MRIIINADDLGLSQTVNRAIKEALSSGCITSSTILANTVYWDEVCSVVDGFPNASFGVHLNLTEGKALIENPLMKRYEIVDSDYCFTKKIKNLDNLPVELREALIDELDLQIKTVVSHGIHISHIDGHHHVHAGSVLSPVIQEIVKRNSITVIRNRYKSPVHFPHFGIKDFFWRSKFIKTGVQFTDYFDSYSGFVKKLKVGEKYGDDTTIELMCHPGGVKYVDEMAQVSSHEISNYLPNVKFISYKEFN